MDNRDCRIMLLGKGRVARAFLQALMASPERYRVIAVCDRRGGVFRSGLLEYVPLHDLGVVCETGRIDVLPCHATFSNDAPADDLRKRLMHAREYDQLSSFATFGEGRYVVVDATDAQFSRLHQGLHDAGFPIVTANKKALGGLTAAEASSIISCGYGFEATVGGGLPVVSTIRNMLAAGDEIKEIRAMASGTFGYVLSLVERGDPFAAALKSAMAHGFTEPDPREDLSGGDVARKALILHRMLGGTMSFEDIRVESLVPEALRDCPVEEFLTRLTHDRSITARLGSGQCGRQRRMRYLARITKTSIEVGLREVDAGEPFASLKGPANMFAIRSRLWDTDPLVISGPGAGPERTAQAMMRDLQRMLG